MTEKIICKLCKKEVKNFNGLATHIRFVHKDISCKDYYDMFLKNKNEGICALENCNKHTKFYSIRKGYAECCSLKCSNNLPNRLNDQSNRMKDLWQNEEYVNIMSNTMSKLWKDEDFKNMMTESGSEFRKRQGDKIRENFKDDEFREYFCNIMKVVCSTNEHKQLIANGICNKYFPELIDKNYDLSTISTMLYEEYPEIKEKISIGVKLAYEKNPDIGDKISNSLLKAYEDLNLREKVSIGVKKAYEERPELRVEAAKRSKKNWEDEDIRNKTITSLKENAKKEEFIEKQRINALELAKDPEWLEKVSARTKHGIEISKDFKQKRSEYMLNGGAAYCNQFIQNPSKPQIELYNKIKELFPSAIINYALIELNYSLDVAIQELKIWFESDGSYWHLDDEKDLIRQRKIEELGWKCIRYKADTIKEVPDKNTILKDIERVLKNE